MAGEWIKMRVDLASDPAVIRIRRATGIDADAVVGKLHRLWAWADTHTEDGTASGLDAEWVDELVGVKGFAVAMQSAGWLEVDADKVRFANFGRHNGRPAKTRALGKTRVERFRNAATVTGALPEEEKKKRREEEEVKKPAAPVATSEPAACSRPTSAVSWSADAGWEGITPEDRAEWAAAYPGAVLDQELAKSHAWLKANPAKAGRRNWRAFLVRWLGRCQDRGGTSREPGNRPQTGPPPVEQAKRRFYRSDAARNMSDSEYAAWRRDQRGGGVSTGLAATLTARTHE
jgi:hypothetical protein